MRWVTAVAIATALAVPTVPLAAAQTVPGTRAFFAARVGWDALRHGRNQEAADAFARAIASEPRDASLHLGAGMAAYLLGQADAAQASLERALRLAPSLTDASLLLGEILYRHSDVPGALRVYEDALRHAPDHPTLSARLDALRREPSLNTGFYQSQGAHFTVLFEGPADEALAVRAVEMLENAYWRVGAALSTYPDRLVTVVLYTQEQFRDVTRSPEWAAAAYDGRIRLPVRGALEDPAELERVLSHEYAHAVIQSIALRGVPTWLSEGLATMMEPAGSRPPAQPASSPDRMPLARLEGSFAGLSGGEARLAYAQSAHAVRRLTEIAGTAPVVAILQEVARGVPFATAFERHVAMRYDAFAATVDNAVDLLR